MKLTITFAHLWMTFVMLGTQASTFLELLHFPQGGGLFVLLLLSFATFLVLARLHALRQHHMNTFVLFAIAVDTRRGMAILMSHLGRDALVMSAVLLQKRSRTPKRSWRHNHIWTRPVFVGPNFYDCHISILLALSSWMPCTVCSS